MRDLAFLDFETTGLDPAKHEIIEAAVVRVDGRTLEERASASVRIWPRRIHTADPEALRINGFQMDTWGGMVLEEALLRIEPLLLDADVAGCSVARFDVPFLMAACDSLGWPRPQLGKYQLDVPSLCWPLFASGKIESLSLQALCDFYGISNEGAHGALVDCRRALEVTRRVLLATPAKRWFSVWLEGYPDEGSMHFEATSDEEALRLARRDEFFSGDPDIEGPPPLAVCPVSDEGHETWDGCSVPPEYEQDDEKTEGGAS